MINRECHDLISAFFIVKQPCTKQVREVSIGHWAFSMHRHSVGLEGLSTTYNTFLQMVGNTALNQFVIVCQI